MGYPPLLGKGKWGALAAGRGIAVLFLFLEDVAAEIKGARGE